ncbi:MAG: hypothetical protein D6714_03475 [Bacteroidetes bacterium]|nr:MAG: hypothetical protein D6714_03475 [Bacteroidota bacterium]
MPNILHIFLFSILFIQGIGAQEATHPFGPVDERLLIETKWRYTYTLHVESNTIIHKADDLYAFYLYFKYDYSYQEYLNGSFSSGHWKLTNRTLHYPFKHIDQFEVAQLNKNVLILEFTQRNSKGTYQYHFVRVSGEEAPFTRPANELPEVLVEALDPHKKERHRWLSFAKRKRRKKRTPPAPISPVYINIELTGGGFYGGIDPVLRDYIHIKSNGRLIKEFQSRHNGLVVIKKDIPREELEAFAEYIVQQKFFDLARIYDCEDALCQKRKQMQPRPVPLRLSVAYGDRKKVVTIAIWGKDDRGIQYVHYPPALDHIIDAIQRMANRMDDPVVRK